MDKDATLRAAAQTSSWLFARSQRLLGTIGKAETSFAKLSHNAEEDLHRDLKVTPAESAAFIAVAQALKNAVISLAGVGDPARKIAAEMGASRDAICALTQRAYLRPKLHASTVAAVLKKAGFMQSGYGRGLGESKFRVSEFSLSLYDLPMREGVCATVSVMDDHHVAEEALKEAGFETAVHGNNIYCARPLSQPLTDEDYVELERLIKEAEGKWLVE